MKLIKVSIKCRDSWSKAKSKSLKGKIFVKNLIKVTIKCRGYYPHCKKCLCLHLTRPKVNLWLFSSRRQCGWSRQKYLIRSMFHILCDIQPDVTNRYTVLCVQIPRHLVSRPHDPFKSPTRDDSFNFYQNSRSTLWWSARSPGVTPCREEHEAPETN